MLQPYTSGFGELGVQSQYLDGERHLVDDALAGRLHFYPQLQIARRVVEAVTVLVVNIFELFEWAAEGFCHKHAVLKRFFTSAKVQSPVSRRMDVAFWADRAPRAAFPPAFFRAEFLLHVVAGVPAVFGAAQIALFGFAAQLALKSRWWFATHVAQLLGRPTLVKETV